jgi:hypothetical protein
MVNFDSVTSKGRVRTAIMRLHSLHLLTPENIMLDEHDDVFLVHVGSSRPFGRIRITAGSVCSM